MWRANASLERKRATPATSPTILAAVMVAHPVIVSSAGARRATTGRRSRSMRSMRVVSAGERSVPRHAAAKEEAEPIVLKVAEAVADATDLLDEQVHASVGALER